MHESIKILVTNRKASFNYFLSDFIECGIELQGTEIKSLRIGGGNISDSYIIIKNNEAFILNMNISPYEKGNIMNHDPLRTRKLLMHKQEILKYDYAIQKGGYTLVPTKVYLSKGKCKVEIALAKGKKLYDKREDKKELSDKRDMDKAIKENNKR